jgi:hypothetical protein
MNYEAKLYPDSGAEKHKRLKVQIRGLKVQEEGMKGMRSFSLFASLFLALSVYTERLP